MSRRLDLMSRCSVIWIRLQLQILILVPAAAAAAVICGGAAAAPQDFILRPAISPALSLLILTSKTTIFFFACCTRRQQQSRMCSLLGSSLIFIYLLNASCITVGLFLLYVLDSSVPGFSLPEFLYGLLKKQKKTRLD